MSLHNVLHDKRLQGAIAGVSVRCAKSGEMLFNHFGNTRLTPASNMKLITAGAALNTLGPDYRFTTEVCTDGKLNSGDLIGNLYLRGKGDPTLLAKDLEDFALKLQSLGMKRIQGNLVGDESWFDDQHLSEDMVWSDEHEYYGAQISALTISPNTDYDAGTIMLTISSEGEIGDSPEFSVSPKTHYVDVINLATVVSSKEEGELGIKRNHGSNTIVLTGTVSQNAAPETKWIAVWNPASYAIEVFYEALERYGISISGHKKIASAPEDVSTLLTRPSMPLSELLIPFMKLSNNGHGEIFIKEMGRVRKGEGSFDAGLEVVKMFLKEEGLNPDNMCLRDGSGISQMNLIQPDEITNLLFKLQNKSWFLTFLNSLPVAGSPERLVGGTLRDRFGGTTAENIVFAKTGSLIGVTSLSGYIKKEEPLIFSIMINHFLDEEEIEKVEDDIILVLSENAL
nr:D-alanyl-D-alanine carboxypeptidase/D-alanyl-D-alanine-endopeptidase [Pseudalkalibacillus spartinae]